MADSYLTQFNMQYYKGAEDVSVLTGQPDQIVYLNELSNDSSNNIYLLEDELDDYNYYISAIDSGNIFLNDNIVGICKGLTNLHNTDLINKSIVNYHYVRNMHSAFANCYNLIGTPISAKRVQSMYGTYYNCQNLTSTPQINANVNNLIGTYYNCKNLSYANCNDNVKVMIDAYANCTNLIGSPKVGSNVISLYNAYYNCFNLTGSPANCNNALITVNAYYNVPHLNGTFYWYEKNYSLAELISATNMFYNRDCSSWLNIYVRPDKSVFNALVNYSSEYGNIYGVGAIDWTEAVSGLYGYHNYENQLYKTRIVPYLRPITLMNYTFKNSFGNDHTSYSSGSYWYDYSNWYFNIWIGVFNNSAEVLAALPPSSTTPTLYLIQYLNSGYGVNIMQARYRYYHHITRYDTSLYYYNFWVNYYFVILNNKDAEDCFWNTTGIPFPRIDNLNSFDYISFFNMDRAKVMDYTFHGRSFQNNQVVYAVCGNNVTDMIYTYQNLLYTNEETNTPIPMNSQAFSLLTNSESGPIYHCLPPEYWQVYDSNWDKFYTNTTMYPTNISIVPICGPNVTKMDHTYTNWKLASKAAIGPNVTEALYTYNGCTNIPNAVCPDLVNNLIGTYYNSDVSKPKIDKNVNNAYRAYGYTYTNSETIVLPKNLPYANYVYRNCGQIYDIENISIVNQYNLKGCFLGCRNLLLEEETTLQLKNNNKFYLAYTFYDCVNMNSIIPFNSDYTIIKNMMFAYFHTNIKNLRDKHFFANNMYAAFANTPLQTGSDMIFFPTGIAPSISYIFANCYALTDDINWNFANYYTQYPDVFPLYGCFRNCTNIRYANFEFNKSCHLPIINSGLFHNCTNLITVNFYNTYNNNVLCNYDGLFYNCQNLTRIIGVESFNGSLCLQPTSTGDTSSTINIDSDYLDNNIFGMYGGQGGHSFENCFNLEYMPNFIDGGIFGTNSFTNCYKIPYFNFLAGWYSTTSYSFIGTHGASYAARGPFYQCHNLRQINFENVRYIYTNDCGFFIRDCENIQKIYISSEHSNRFEMELTGAIILAHSCSNLNYFIECNLIQSSYYPSSGEEPILYNTYLPVVFNFNKAYRAQGYYGDSSIIENERTLVRDCLNFKDLTNVNYGVYYNSNFQYDDRYVNSDFYSLNYTGNLVELVINSNYTPLGILNNDNLLKLEYLTVLFNEHYGWRNQGLANVNTQIEGYNTQQLHVKIFNNLYTSQTNTILNRCILAVRNRWVGIKWNESVNSYIKSNTTSTRNLWHLSELFQNTLYTKINLFMFDDRAYVDNIASVGSGDRDTTNGYHIYSRLTTKNHTFNLLFNYTLSSLQNINIFVMQPIYNYLAEGGYSSELLSFELHNIINSKIMSLYSPYYSNLNRILPTTPHINSFCFDYYTYSHFDPYSRSFNEIYTDPTYLSSINFYNIIGPGFQDFSLIFGTGFNISNFNPVRDEDVANNYQQKIMYLRPTKVYLNYNDGSRTIQRNFYTRGTLGEHVAYLGPSDINAKYFGDLTFTESRTLLASYPQESNLSRFTISNIQMERTNDIVTQFSFNYFPSYYGATSYRGDYSAGRSTNFNLPIVFNHFFGFNNNYWYIQSVLNNMNYSLNMYEVDMYNSQHNIHIKWIEENFELEP